MSGDSDDDVGGDGDGYIPLESSDEEEEDETGAGAVLPPWFRHEHWCPENVLVTLHNEILDFCDLVKPTKAEHEDAERALNFVTQVAEQVLGNGVAVHVFGSHLTKLLVPSSDLDLVIMNAPSNAIHLLSRDLRRRSNTGEIESLEVIGKAKVPIIKFVYVPPGGTAKLNCDICFNQTSGINTGRQTVALLSEYEPARPLALVMKHYLAQRKHNETYQGGVGSFLLQLMAISSVQYNLGSLLLHFLHMFGEGFNYEEVGISVQDKGYFFRKDQLGRTDALRPWLLSMENPWETNLDVGKNSYQIQTISQSFESNHMALQKALADRNPNQTPRSYLATVIKVDESLASRALPAYPLFRAQEFNVHAEEQQAHGKRRRRDSSDEEVSDTGSLRHRSDRKGSSAHQTQPRHRSAVVQSAGAVPGHGAGHVRSRVLPR
ncbi:hypothetical protein JKP88DRAFT_348807 [Tribonema minus]|uniref:Uncharacterized protein n=1 Tax=Tribonema minus TaxID=303371 RepID=A0A835YW64_9STRA|nr:hypothetical protein JKP88DRAFT_348807 [Tribonema minus]